MITVDNIILLCAGIAGVLIHNLMKLDEENRKLDGNISIVKYWRLERFSILFSVVFIFVCLALKHEVKQLENAGKWLGWGFFAGGYCTQSILVKLRKWIKKITDGE